MGIHYFHLKIHYQCLKQYIFCIYFVLNQISVVHYGQPKFAEIWHDCTVTPKGVCTLENCDL